MPSFGPCDASTRGTQAGRESALRCAALCCAVLCCAVLCCFVRQAGLFCEIQVTSVAIGQVDMVVEKRLVVEADSCLAHCGCEKQVADRTRDLQLAQPELMTLRPLCQHIMFSPNGGGLAQPATRPIRG